MITSYTFSQCTPDTTFKGPQIFNVDTLDTIKPAVAEYTYSCEITVKIPEDTLISGIPMPIAIDSAGIESVNNLPSGFTWQTNSSTNYWPGDSYGCFVINGNPTMSQLGVDTFAVVMSARGFGQVMPFTFRFLIEIIDSIYYGIEEIKNQRFEVYQNSPNPFLNKTEIKFFSSEKANMRFQVFNIIGEVVYSEIINAEKGNNKITFNSNNLQSGLYLYRLGNSTKTITRKMIIK